MSLTPDTDLDAMIAKQVVKMVSDPKLQKKIIKKVKERILLTDTFPSVLDIIKIIKKY